MMKQNKINNRTTAIATTKQEKKARKEMDLLFFYLKK